jgi:addiction module HigA family antidote
MSKTSLVSPGTVLKEQFMAPYQLKPAGLAKGIGVNPAVISNILNEKQRITLPIALRLVKFFKTAENYWTDLQFRYDYERVSGDPALKSALREIKPAVKPKAGAKKAAKAAKGAGKSPAKAKNAVKAKSAAKNKARTAKRGRKARTA